MINDELLKREMRTNIIDEETSQLIIGKTLNKISNSIANTLGPYGSYTIIKDPYGIDHSITKDGFTVLNKIRFDGSMQSAINNIVVKVSRALVQEVGDASTSSVIVADAMYDTLIDFFNRNILPRKDVLDTLTELEDIIEEYIFSYSKKLTNKEQLTKIASISNNNDRKLGDLVASIYEELDFQGFINLELSPNNNTFYKITNGVEVERSYINFIYTNQKDKTTCIYENPKILMCNETLDETDLEFLGQILEMTVASGNPLVIIAKGYAPDITNVLNCNKVKLKEKFPVLPIEYSLSNLRQHSEFEDLAIYLGATIYDKYNDNAIPPEEAGKFFKNGLGTCNKVTSDGKRTTLVEGHYNEEMLNDRIDLIDEAIEKLNEKKNYTDISMEKYDLERRKNTIKGKIASLYVGGDSDIEKRTKRDLVEDSIFSCRSAIKYGYVLGGNLIVPHILRHNFTDIVNKILNNTEIFKGFTKEERKGYVSELLDLVAESFLVSFTRVLYNKFRNYDTAKRCALNCIQDSELKIFNLKNNRFESIENSEVINSAKTDIEIMHSVFSIIGLLASSNQMLALDCIY